jgi:hypothetical protein
LDINVTTAFYWRHKILNARKDGKSDAVLEEHTQADETFIYLNTKGNKNAYNNLHRGEPIFREPDYKRVRKSGHRHGRGSSCSSTRGLNAGLVCTPFAIGGNDVCWGKPSNMGAPTADDLDAVYAGHLGESVILVTDASTAARKYAEDKELPIIQLKSKTESRQGKHTLQKINNLHTSFKQETPGITVTTRATLLADKLRNVSKVARWKDLRDKDYPPFVYEWLDTIPGNEAPIWIVDQSHIK